jgi:hypothetical protein
MKIKKEFIGSKCWSPIMSKFFIIEEGKEELYCNLGIFDIYEIEKPKLIKYVINTKKRNDAIDSDGDGIDNDSESKLSI